jgi:ATP-dependent Lhr-like helicase
VVYVSPFIALSNDIRKNLASPLGEIAALAEAAGTPLPEIMASVRTGDTKAYDRDKIEKRPFHILLISRSGRQGLTSVRTQILD